MFCPTIFQILAEGEIKNSNPAGIESEVVAYEA